MSIHLSSKISFCNWWTPWGSTPGNRWLFSHLASLQFFAPLLWDAFCEEFVWPWNFEKKKVHCWNFSGAFYPIDILPHRKSKCMVGIELKQCLQDFLETWSIGIVKRWNRYTFWRIFIFRNEKKTKLFQSKVSCCIKRQICWNCGKCGSLWFFF